GQTLESPPPSTHYCVSHELHRDLKQHYPRYSEQFNTFYEAAVQHSQTASLARNEWDTYVIPVVVHIVWDQPESNLSESRIHQQLAVLNEDFQRNNPDTNQTRSVFAPVMDNAGIAFELIDIIRVKTDTTFSLDFDWNTFTFRYPDHVKQSARGGSDPRDVDTYLNIWVCPIQSDQFFGYAYPPDGISNWPPEFLAPNKQFDGVVINYKAFGRDLDPFIDQEGNVIPLNGRITTHEVGHYLGLRHPWGDGGFDTPGCQVDDGLADTPNAAFPANFTCDFSQNSCVENDDSDLPDMIENFMDYAPDDCKNGFTKNQSALMRYVLRNHRSLLRIKNVPIAQRDEVLVYPNPTQGPVNIFVNPQVDLNYDIRIINMAQQNILTTVQANLYNRNDYYRFDLSQHGAGLYLIEFATNGRRVFTKKVVVLP
ncbi:MAG: T9SS type A sorting domain-containing protein, partial [Bacteroidota bacterium]